MPQGAIIRNVTRAMRTIKQVELMGREWARDIAAGAGPGAPFLLTQNT